jgi:hypothetical protein
MIKLALAIAFLTVFGLIGLAVILVLTKYFNELKDNKNDNNNNLNNK